MLQVGTLGFTLHPVTDCPHTFPYFQLLRRMPERHVPGAPGWSPVLAHGCNMTVRAASGWTYTEHTYTGAALVWVIPREFILS